MIPVPVEVGGGITILMGSRNERILVDQQTWVLIAKAASC